MPNEHDLSPDELARQARQHLASLRAAGVEWLPTAPPTAAASASAPAGSLFDAQERIAPAGGSGTADERRQALVSRTPIGMRSP